MSWLAVGPASENKIRVKLSKRIAIEFVV